MTQRMGDPFPHYEMASLGDREEKGVINRFGEHF